MASDDFGSFDDGFDVLRLTIGRLLLVGKNATLVVSSRAVPLVNREWALTTRLRSLF